MKKLPILLIIGFCIPLLAQRFVRTANTISELIASNPASVHTNVMVLGLTNATDNFGGVFSWVSGSTNTTNGFDTFSSTYTTNVGRWLRKSYSSTTNYGSTTYTTNLYATNIYNTTLVSSNIYVTNLFVTNINGGAANTIIAYQTNGAGADFGYGIAVDTYEEIIFGTSGSSFVITNAGTYQISFTIACFDAGTFPQTFYLTNTTDNLHVAGPASVFVTSQSYYPIILIKQVTTAGDNRTFRLYGKTANTTYTQAGVGATNTILSVLRVN